MKKILLFISLAIGCELALAETFVWQGYKFDGVYPVISKNGTKGYFWTDSGPLKAAPGKKVSVREARKIWVVWPHPLKDRLAMEKITAHSNMKWVEKKLMYVYPKGKGKYGSEVFSYRYDCQTKRMSGEAEAYSGPFGQGKKVWSGSAGEQIWGHMVPNAVNPSEVGKKAMERLYAGLCRDVSAW